MVHAVLCNSYMALHGLLETDSQQCCHSAVLCDPVYSLLFMMVCPSLSSVSVKAVERSRHVSSLNGTAGYDFFSGLWGAVTFVGMLDLLSLCL